MSELALGIDIGTTGVKAVLIDKEGNLIREVNKPHDLISLKSSWAEEDTAAWYKNVVTAIKELLASGIESNQIKSLGISGMVPALVLLNEKGEVLRYSIQQNDARAVEEIKLLQQRLDPQEVYRRTGSFINQQHVGPRLLWVKRNEPDVWRRLRAVCGSYDYLVYRITGKLSLEINWAVESGLFDIWEQEWIPEFLEAAEVLREFFPPVRRSLEIVGEVSPSFAKESGLRAGTPVIAGSADHVASALAAGVREEGDLLIKFGGAGDILYCIDELKTNPRLYIDFHVIPGKFLLNGCMASSGSLVKWFVVNVLGQDATPEILTQLDREAKRVPPGAGGLIVLPYFLGEKTPILDPLARGVFFGLSLHHGRGHIFRAILEAVIFGFRHHVEVLEEMGCNIRRVFATNGGVKSQLWTQIAADILGREVRSFPGHPGSALGVAFLAGKSAGLFKTWEEIELFLRHSRCFIPDETQVKLYQNAYSVYRKLYEDLKSDFPLLQPLQHIEVKN
ncbi:xylulokinase [Thermanaeromonas toyohensis ToBE]|uniref:Xylulokinase n=1 Tax=Thermanaeromonas toyohensis ToBE TaxID=698762 RepID=A0A1W1VXW9_9FIRM|nr:FGGY-family carbohydrate kinase [Thermanaeromonas toyohensis]SMB98188.1 xylulokinase [Thermanaeromonas toyohensis ToBE]